MPIVVSETATGRGQYSVLSASYTVSSTTNVPTTGDYRASNIALLSQPRRVARSSSTALTRFVLDFGAVTAIDVFSIERVNFASLQLEGGDDGSTWTPFGQTFATDQTDIDDGRRKLLIVPTSTFNFRYARLTPSVPDSGASYYEIGLFAAWPTCTTLVHNIGVPYEKTGEGDPERLTFQGGSVQVATPPAYKLRLTMTGRVPREDADAREQFGELVRVPEDRVVLWYEGESDLTKIYHVQRAAHATVRRNNDGHIDVTSLQFLEVA